MLNPKSTTGDTDWFVQDRFGMFIHWGIYALAARDEWVKSREEITDEDYQKYFLHFDPELYNPKEWARQARLAGMKYFVITTKHHDGFCLWDTRQTDYKAPNTPAKRDLIKEAVDAFRSEGLHVGFYYSLLDWYHPHYTIDPQHPLRNREDVEELNANRDMKIYTQYMRDQVRELLTNYGKIDVLFFDFSSPEVNFNNLRGKGHNDWESEKLLALVRELQPHIIVNNRLDLPRQMADVHTPEQFQPQTWLLVDGEPVVWETCQTFSGSWGYHRDESSWKSPEQLIKMLIDSVSRGGNLLMNVGPTARGTFDHRATDALGEYAQWMKLHERSIYGCTQSTFEEPQGVRFTYNPQTNRLYVHIYSWPFKYLHLPNLASKIDYAQLLSDGSELAHTLPGEDTLHGNLAFSTDPETATINLPVQKPDVIVPVVEVFLK